MRLTVEKLSSDDTYLDRVRLHRDFRGGIRIGQICRLSTPKANALVEVRGTNVSGQTIYMDQPMRRKLGLKLGDKPEFNLRRAYYWERLWWAANATDQTSALAAHMGLISLGLGALSLLLGLLSIWLTVR
ncbi:hypothetical protein [Parvibaculum sp.]|uniref:hypothetical protein n=1 Tax=Parvibaculum sp. TaxID=2024848 RepID=UPI002C14839A|nr:hypothetical protein [Parvibaculum sp.]HUD50590.1 hypothetical protein [Parvibaculum sp.]